ncbi:receptor-type tyrosine-protein phosphatase C [Magallana gigas]|uniref:receptor-type tyrosine-protein phosphatase C n=1 Tax=Magallana gigas TaxID=29159 RepID=UPI003340C3D4
MVWQEDVYVIAMVTNLSEGGTIKCAKYWPDNTGDKIKIDIFGIQLDSEKTYSSFLIHQLQLTNLKTKASRQITHLQYTSWPDHGTPDPLELLMYHQYVTKAMRKHPENKLLVHCSAGIGRTGTFIALDALYRHGIKEGSINIVEYVHTMREDRMNIIQNLDQYKFLYRALYESFRATIHPFSKEKFIDEVKSVLSSDNTVNLSNLRIQFKELDSLKPVFQENEKSSGFENMTLNMTGSVLPADRIRIILSSHVKGRGTYYNAAPVSTFTMRDCVITGQYPVPGAAVDLIRLLVDQECSTLISTSPLSEVPSSIEWFYPSPRGNMIFQYRVQIDEGVKITDYVIKSTIRIKASAASDWQDVTLYEMNTWHTNDKLPLEYRPILDVVSLLHLNENVDAENKIAVLSRDGSSRCGEFCAVYNAIQQLQQDQEVDMFTIVRQLQRRRPEMISVFEEFMFSCQTVSQFIEQNPDEVNINYNHALVGENIYANA